MKLPSWYNVLISVTVSLGSFTYGYAITSLANVLSQPAFYVAMKLDPVGPGRDHATSIIAWWNCIIYAAGFFACLSTPFFADRYGRRKALAIGAAFAVLGAALQAGSITAEMLIVARVFVGFGNGFLLAAVPLYQAEISPPASRGLIVGLHASLLGYGTMVASWIAAAFFHVPGPAGWRTPLALQTVFPLALVIAVWFIPESPRWLCMHNRHEEAARSLEKLHSNKKDPEHHFAHKELEIIRAQLAHEARTQMTIFEALRVRSLQKRFILGWFAMTCTQAGGLIVVLTYQAVIYGSLGFNGFLVIIFSGIWCFCNGTGNLVGGVLGDYIGRKRQIFWGLLILDVALILLCTLTRLYAGTENRAGNIAATVFTFLLICIYTAGVECTCFVYMAELFPGQWRAFGVGFSVSATFFWASIFTAAASPAFARIGALYYLVFIGMTSVMAVVVYFGFPNTSNYTLEQMAAVFGDEVVDMHGNIEAGRDFVKESDATKLTEETVEMVEGGENQPAKA